MPDAPGINRREFVTTAAGAAAALGLTGRVLNRALGDDAKPVNPDDPAKGGTINVGLIGCGGQMNGYHITKLLELGKNGAEDVKIVAVCDIYEPRLQRAVERTGGKAYHNYTDLLKHPGLHAVHIATPDHWHCRMASDALNAGLDVYCEKPVTYTWEEAKELRDLVRKTNRVFQVGVQTTSEGVWHKAGELIKAGAIGKVVWSQTSYSRNSTGGEWNYAIDPEASEKNLDWEAFLGSAPKRPFSKPRFFQWRKYWDYSGGIATDLFFHQMSHMVCALGPGELPVRVSAGGGIWVQKDDREVPDTYFMMVDYPSDHSLIVVASMANRLGVQELIRGHEATISFEGRDVVIKPEDEFKDKRKEEKVAEDWRRDHIQNFIQCIRTRKTPDCPITLAYPVMTAINLGVKSYRENKVFRFDPAKEMIIG